MLEMQEFIQCPKCGRVSYNKGDIENKYCSICGFHADFAVAVRTPRRLHWDATDMSLKLDPDDVIGIEMSAELRDKLNKMKPGEPWQEMRFSHWDDGKAIYVPKKEGDES